MKTLLFAPCYLDGKDWQGYERVKRIQDWLFFHIQLKDQLGFDEIWMSDDCSDPENLEATGASIWNDKLQPMNGGNPRIGLVNIVSYRKPLVSGGGSCVNYPYCWKALYVMRSVMERFDYSKSITLDTDAYVLSQRLASYVKSLKSGWTAFWINKYNFPSAEFHVLTQPALHQFEDFTEPPYMAHQGKLMETSLPFTNINRDFICDRFGEQGVQQHPQMDLYSQYRGDVKLAFH
jgi:hypothetical protein